MNIPRNPARGPTAGLPRLIVAVALAACVGLLGPVSAHAQVDPPGPILPPAPVAGVGGDAGTTAPAPPSETGGATAVQPDVASRMAEAEARAKADLAAEEETDSSQDDAAPPVDVPQLNVLDLLAKGGPLVWPILAVSLIVVMFGAERFLALRRGNVFPVRLDEGLRQLSSQRGGFDPRRAYQLCQQFPSAAATVVQAMLLKVGRPHSELEHAVSEASDREAARLYANVRWINLAAAISPLLGLLGTVWGMIQAFIATAVLPTGANKSQELAKGIYQALVTTFVGLAVAIPAAVMAHWFEGRIQKLFRQLDEKLHGLLPQLERFEGRVRVSHDQLTQPPGSQTPPPVGQTPPPVSQTPPPVIQDPARPGDPARSQPRRQATDGNLGSGRPATTRE